MSSQELIGMDCPLCKNSQSLEFSRVSEKRVFYSCPFCQLKFLRPDLRLKAEAEKARYDQHQNDIQDLDYQKFLSPMLQAVERRIAPPAEGLDFGCGPGPVAAELLRRKGYEMDLYDPFYQPHQEILKPQYDFIICSEAMEHFFNPDQEIEFLSAKLKPGAHLFVMTQLWQEQGAFSQWAYQRDSTHVIFFERKTFEWIQKKWMFKNLEFINTNLIVLYK